MIQRMQRAWIRLMPMLFVLLWSTGFIGAKYGLPYAEPFTFLLIRMLIALVILGLLARILAARWPRGRLAGHVAVTGMLVHGVYLGGVFYAIELGMPAGLAALLVGLQPLLTAMVAILVLREQVSVRKWVGLALGLIGVVLVLGERIQGGPDQLFAGFPLWALGWAGAALLGISIGTVYQKRFCVGMDLISGTFIQYCAAALIFALGAALLETGEIQWVPELWFALGWLVLVLSLGAVLLLMTLIKQGAATQVASLFYLVPPVTAFEAFFLFGERLGVQAVIGGLVAVAGVALVIYQKRAQHG